MPGSRGIFFGKVAQRGLSLTLQTPGFELLEAGESPPEGLTPVYPLTEGLHQKAIRSLIAGQLDRLAPFETDVLPPGLRLHLPPLPEALQTLHRPDTEEDAERARARLAFEELLILQVALAIKQHHKQAPHPQSAVVGPGRFVDTLQKSLPFSLTGAQSRAIEEIVKDLRSPRTMARLLQGDVGAGKTVVAAAAIAATIEAGHQAALMAPTELLAEQHAKTLTQLLGPLQIAPALLTGNTTKADRRQLIEALQAGEAPLLVGTHALIERDVLFHQLGLVIIDEQHRFGVGQRAKLAQKMGDPNTLVMTATPIPRTLSVTLFGDLDVTLLDEMPPGRTPIQTSWKRPASLPKVWEQLCKELSQGSQEYVVCPLIEESEKLEAQAASELASELQAGPFKEFKVGLLHGRLSKEEKEATMDSFRQGKTNLLVATTVIEVGVDVPQATHMVILNAERFGLGQLHQLRGRVGRGQKSSRCTLISKGGGEETRRRLKVLTQSTDGFVVAEEDLAIRGPGEYFGTRQAGLPALRFADLSKDTRLLDQARQKARELVTKDPSLSSRELAPFAARVQEKFARFLEGRH